MLRLVACWNFSKTKYPSTQFYVFFNSFSLVYSKIYLVKCNNQEMIHYLDKSSAQIIICYLDNASAQMIIYYLDEASFIWETLQVFIKFNIFKSTKNLLFSCCLSYSISSKEYQYDGLGLKVIRTFLLKQRHLTEQLSPAFVIIAYRIAKLNA